MATFLEIQNAVSDRSKRPKLTDLTEIKREINETVAELAALLKLDVQTSVLVPLTGTNPFSITTAQPTGLGLTGATLSDSGAFSVLCLAGFFTGSVSEPVSTGFV